MEQLLHYSPIIVAIMVFLIQQRIVVTPEQLEKKHREILEDVEEKFVTLNSFNDLKDTPNLDLIKDRNWEENEIEFVKNNYKMMATDEIAELLDRSFYSVQVKANRMGLKKSPYHCNYHYFDEVNSEEKAYWLGMLYSDGCINSANGQVNLTLNEKDLPHLEKLKKFL